MNGRIFQLKGSLITGQANCLTYKVLQIWVNVKTDRTFNNRHSGHMPVVWASNWPPNTERKELRTMLHKYMMQMNLW